MLFKMILLEKIREGSVTLAFRSWKKAMVNNRSTLKTAVGVLVGEEIKSAMMEQITDADGLTTTFRKMSGAKIFWIKFRYL